MGIVADEHKPDILICHISDLHVRSDKSIGLSRVRQLSGAIGSRITRQTSVVVVISGDIAYSGKPEEYALAATAFLELKESLRAWPVVEFHLVAAPGNHDCDFDAISTVVQSALIKDIPDSGAGVESIAKELVRTQTEFRRFHAAYGAHADPLGELLFHARLELQGRTLSFHLVNTAWTSRLREVAGTMRMPRGCLRDPDEESDLSIAVAHHPLNWFLPQDARYFSEWLDTHVDVALWGHEHAIDDFEQARVRFGSRVKHMIALPIEDPEYTCGFSCLKIDASDTTIKKSTFQWVGDDPRLVDEGAGDTCPLNPARLLGKVRFLTKYVDFLDDPGMLIKHPQLTRHLKLSEILVHSEFRGVNSSKLEIEKISANLGLSDIIQEAIQSKKIIVFGSEQSGKTTLAKVLVSEFRRRGLVPLYLDIAQLTSANRGVIRGWLNSAIQSQYEYDCHDEIARLEPKNRFVIIDNLQTCPAGSSGISRVFELANTWAGGMVALTGDAPALAVLSAEYDQNDETAYWKGAGFFELLPLSHKRRGELIRKWVGIGRTETLSPEAIEHEARQVKSVVDAWLGKHFLPRYPVFVLVLLQQLDVGRELKTAISNGSQGFIFEALITKALEGFVHKHPINTVRDFLSELAGELLRRESGYVDKNVIEDLHGRFTARLVTIKLDALLEELDAAKLISIDARGVGFRYPFLGYYFHALWVSRMEADERLAQIGRLVEFVHTERAANVLIFLSHFEKQHEVLAKLLPLAESLYEDAPQGMLSEHSKLCIRFRTAEEKEVLLLGKPDQVSDHVHSERDSIDAMMRRNDEREARAQVDESVKLNTATKTVQVLGQILKSRASGISAEKKVEIATTTMTLTRRMMSFLYGIIHDNADMFVHHASDAFESVFKVDKAEAIKIANGFIGLLVVGFGKAAVGKAAEALASSELPLLLKRLEGSGADEDSRLMLLVARLIGDREYPSQAVIDFSSAIRPANILAHSILAWAVARRFHLDPPDHSVRDQACALLGIETRRLPVRVMGSKFSSAS